MARVPTLDLPTVGASDGTSARVQPVDARSPAFDQMQKTGAAMEQAGSDFANIQAQQLQLANQIRVNDAINQLKERQATLTYDPDQGYSQKKGIDAFEKDGSSYSLGQDYGDKLRSASDEIMASLGNSAQRKAFASASGNIQTGFNADIQAHVGNEFKNYGMSVQDGMIANNVDAMSRYGADASDAGRAKFDGATQALRAAVFQKGRLLGQSAEAIEAETRDQLSKAHATVAATMLQNNDFGTAQSYIDAHKMEINAPELLQLQTGITKQQVSTYATNVASKAFYGSGGGDPTSAASQMFPSNMDRLTNLAGLTHAVGTVESGNRDHNKDGSPVVSKAGAKYEMQVMPATAKDPGFGIAPAASDTPEEYNRVGRELLPKLIQHYGGDVVHALWANNWGVGNVDAYLKTGKGAKGQPMPEETQQYANKVYAAYKGGGGNPSASDHQTSLSGIYKSLEADPFLQAHPEGMEAAMNHVRTLYAAEKEDRANAEDSAYGTVQRQVLGNGGVITPQMYAQTPDSKLSAITSFGESVQSANRNPVKTSDPIVYGNLLTRVANGDITDPNSREMLNASLKLTNNDFQSLQNMVAKTQSRDQQQIDHNNLAQRTLTMLAPDLQAAGLNPHPKEDDSQDDKDTIAAYTGQLYEQLSRATQAKGKPLTTAEARSVGLQLLAERPGTGGWFSGNKRNFQISAAREGSGQGLAGMTGTTRNLIVARLQAAGFPPTEDNIRRYFAAQKVD